MSRISDRFDRLADKGDQLGQTPALLAAAAVELSPVHQAVASFLDDVIGRMTDPGAVAKMPAAGRLIATTLSSSRGMIRDSLGRIPEAVLREQLETLRGNITVALGNDGPA